MARLRVIKGDKPDQRASEVLTYVQVSTAARSAVLAITCALSEVERTFSGSFTTPRKLADARDRLAMIAQLATAAREALE